MRCQLMVVINYHNHVSDETINNNPLKSLNKLAGERISMSIVIDEAWFEF